MGLLDLFAKDKRDERARAKNISRALNKYAQSADRSRALEALADDGSDEALYGLLRRFALMYDKTIEDEQEKEWVFQALVAKGGAALSAVKKYLVAADSISWPLRVLDEIASQEEELVALEGVLARHEPGYERDPSKKIQLLSHIARMKEPRAPSLIVPSRAAGLRRARAAPGRRTPDRARADDLRRANGPRPPALRCARAPPGAPRARAARRPTRRRAA
jgi:hypothetical protein